MSAAQTGDEMDRIDKIRARINKQLPLYTNDAEFLLAKIGLLTTDAGALSAWQCIHPDGETGIVCTEHGHQICAKDKIIATLTARNEELVEALIAVIIRGDKPNNRTNRRSGG